ncbi:MAG: 1-acyl-sn-glycerol-3-phosphate acyltransferase [Bdellovibrionota bacterium]
METFRGGLLLLVRWLVHYPIVFGTYRVKNWSRAPFFLQQELQEKPGILVSNYGNYFYDDILGAMLAPVWPFTFVKDSVFRVPFLKPFYRFFRCIPIIRSSDQYYKSDQRIAKNEQTLDHVAGLLHRGHWFSVFPEADPRHRSQLVKPLRPGVAHVALRAERKANWKLGLQIYVYGTNYENKFAGRSYLYLRWAAPISVARYQGLYERDERAAEEMLLSEVEAALHSVVLEAQTLDQLVDAHRLAYQKGQANFSGVHQALNDVVTRKAAPRELRRIVCRKRESLSYQIIGYVLWFVGGALGWPLRTFGKLCAKDRSEEMTFQFTLWSLILLTGFVVGEEDWVVVQALGTWLAMTMWLWGWRRGMIER